MIYSPIPGVSFSILYVELFVSSNSDKKKLLELLLKM